MSIDQYLRQSAQRFGDKTAIHYGDETITYRQLDQEVDNIAQGLISLGLKHHDKVAVILGNNASFVRIYFALQRVGCTIVPLNQTFKQHEIEYILNDANIHYLITAKDFLPEIQGLRDRYPELKVVITDSGADDTTYSTADFMAKTAAPVASAAAGPDIAAILYTSGTTGNPKGALLTHDNIMYLSEVAIKRMDMRPDDNLLCVIPLSHVFSQITNMVMPISIGATIIILPQFIPDLVLSEIAKWKISYFCAVPAMFGALLSVLTRNPGYDISSLRSCVSGGAPLPLEVYHAFHKMYGLTIVEGSGPTEAVACCGIHSANKPGSVGPAMEGIAVRVVDENDQPLPTGEVGELCVKGPTVMQGYLNNPEATAQALKDGWFHTGDLARIDEDGYVFIMGRIKDMILVGGRNVYPAEVEQCLYQYPKVLEAAVVGIPDKDRGEIPKAFIVLKPGDEADAKEIILHCRKLLANYKCPREVVFVDSLPKNNAGKVDKKLLQ